MKGNLKLPENKERSWAAATKVATGGLGNSGRRSYTRIFGYDTQETNVRVTRYRNVESKKEGEL
jgi:alanyl-tRNA synthetase